ncbi:MAG: hypothetical protein ACJ76Y_15920 [Thermoanaerobaculia bacterium]
MSLLAALLAGPAGAVTVNHSMLSGDPNRDPSWDWTINTTYPLYVSGLSSSVNVLLPYYAATGPAAGDLNIAGDRDIYPSQGWVLVVRDFGSSTAPTSLPYFILYNRYRGILRLFYWSTLPSSFDHAAASLHFQQTTAAKTAALMSLSDSSHMTAGDYNPSRAEIVIGKIAWQQWSYLDFDLAGYDPNLASKTDPTLVFDLTGVNTSNLVVNGTIDLNQILEVNQPNSSNGFQNIVNGAVSLFTKPAARYKQIADAQTAFTNLGKDKLGTWWGQYLNDIGTTLSGAAWLRGLGPVIGVLESIFGGGSSSPSQPKPLIFHGTVSLQGTITSQSVLYTIVLRAPGAIHADPTNDAISNVLPLYDHPLGVFNLLNPPILETFLDEGVGYCYNGFDTWDYEYYYTRQVDQKLKTLTYAVNPWSGLQVQSLTAAYIPDDGFPEFYQEGVSDGYHPPCELSSYVVDDFYPNAGAHDYCDRIDYGAYYPRRIGVKVDLAPSPLPTGFEPTTFIKAYATSAQYVDNPPVGTNTCQ